MVETEREKARAGDGDRRRLSENQSEFTNHQSNNYHHRMKRKKNITGRPLRL